jgi:hypothetical protein
MADKQSRSDYDVDKPTESLYTVKAPEDTPSNTNAAETVRPSLLSSLFLISALLVSLYSFPPSLHLFSFSFIILFLLLLRHPQPSSSSPTTEPSPKLEVLPGFPGPLSRDHVDRTETPSLHAAPSSDHEYAKVIDSRLLVVFPKAVRQEQEGTLYIGEYKQLEGTREVAVKKVNCEVEDLQRTADLMHMCRHENVVHVVGWAPELLLLCTGNSYN